MKFIIIFLMFLFFFGCIINKLSKKEIIERSIYKQYVGECRDDWRFFDLNDTLKNTCFIISF